MNYQYLPNVEAQNADIIIQRISYGGSVSAKEGTHKAPEAILKASNQIEYYDEDLNWSPMKYMNVCVSDSVSVYDKISSSVNSLNVSSKQLLISLGGDHSLTPKVTSVLLKENSTIVFLDAHADLRESFMGDEFSHATPAFHLLQQGHKLIMVGIRSMFEDEAIRVKNDENIIFFSDRELQKRDVRGVLLENLSSLSGDVYISIDMDVFNPAFVPSVGTPQAGGIDYYFATDILEAIFLNSKAEVKGVDLVEIIPEPSTVSESFAAKLLQKIISYWGKSKKFDKKAQIGAQMRVEYE